MVVPTFNRPDLLDRCLSALVTQSIGPSSYEIIVADDAACETTRCQVEAWRRRCSAAGPAITYVPVRARHGPAAARNAGWRQARGPVIAFTDDDCVPDGGWLAAGVRAIREGATGVSGRIIVPLPKDPTDYERNAAGLATSEFVTANCFYRQSALAAVGGFDERFAMAWREDADLWLTFMGRGEPLVAAEDAVVIHPLRPAPVGCEPAPAAEEPVQRATLQKAPGALPTTGSAGASARLLHDRRLDCRVLSGHPVEEAAISGRQRRDLGKVDGGFHRAAVARYVPAPQPCRRDGGDLRPDSTARRLLAAARCNRVPGAFSLAT